VEPNDQRREVIDGAFNDHTMRSAQHQSRRRVTRLLCEADRHKRWLAGEAPDGWPRHTKLTLYLRHRRASGDALSDVADQTLSERTLESPTMLWCTQLLDGPTQHLTARHTLTSAVTMAHWHQVSGRTGRGATLNPTETRTIDGVRLRVPPNNSQMILESLTKNLTTPNDQTHQTVNDLKS